MGTVLIGDFHGASGIIREGSHDRDAVFFDVANKESRSPNSGGDIGGVEGAAALVGGNDEQEGALPQIVVALVRAKAKSGKLTDSGKCAIVESQVGAGRSLGREPFPRGEAILKVGIPNRLVFECNEHLINHSFDAGIGERSSGDRDSRLHQNTNAQTNGCCQGEPLGKHI